MQAYFSHGRFRLVLFFREEDFALIEINNLLNKLLKKETEERVAEIRKLQKELSNTK